jgi:hypothetical protein
MAGGTRTQGLGRLHIRTLRWELWSVGSALWYYGLRCLGLMLLPYTGVSRLRLKDIKTFPG